MLKFIRLSPSSILNCHIPKGTMLLKRLKLGLSHLHDYNFKHRFHDLLNPICNCGSHFGTTPHYLLHYPLFSDERLIPINNIWNMPYALNLNDSRFSEVLLFGNFSLSNRKNLRYFFILYIHA